MYNNTETENTIWYANLCIHVTKLNEDDNIIIIIILSERLSHNVHQVRDMCNIGKYLITRIESYMRAGATCCN